MIEVTASQLFEMMREIGQEREKVVSELSYSRQIADLGMKANNSLEDHLENLNMAYEKLLIQVEKFEIVN